MKTRLVALACACGLFVLLCVVLFLVNQTAGAVALAGAVHPALGRVLLIALLVLYAVLVGYPVVMILRMPPPLRPPADERSPEYARHLDRLRARLARNPHLAGERVRLEDREGIEEAIGVLDARADAVARSAASFVFVTTAISQNGRLDALVVLAAHARMVWRLARIYDQRPSPRDLAWLYANVGATVFLAGALEDLDIAGQVEPVLGSALAGSAAGAIPGAGPVALLLTQSILDGAANAFLTLRIAVICRRYCGALTRVDRRALHRAASVRAAGMLGAIVAESAGVVAGAVRAAAEKALAGTIGSVTDGLGRALSRLNPLRREPGGG